jgi:hypothetical protein
MSPNSFLYSFYRLGDPVMDWRCLPSRSSSFLLCPQGADGPRVCGGRSATWLFVACSSCSCPCSFSTRCVFEFWLGEVSDGPRVPGGQSAGAGRTVRVLPRTVRFSGFASGGSVGFNGQSAAQAGRSAVPVWTVCNTFGGQSTWLVRTVRPSWPDGPLEPGCFVPRFDSSLLLSCFRVCFKESFLRLEVDP